jgi:hypothetical protein
VPAAPSATDATMIATPAIATPEPAPTASVPAVVR